MKRFAPKLLEKRSRIQARPDDSAPNDDKRPPKFCLEFLSKDFCISACTKNEKAAFADRLREMSSLTWEQLRHAPRDKQGYEQIAHSAIRAGLPKHITEDTKLLAFRCFGKAPMVGYRDKSVFHIIWFDREFKLYKHS